MSGAKTDEAAGAVRSRDLRITAFNTGTLARMLVSVGKLIGWLLPLRNPAALFFFFPFCHVGGAEKVHADIVGCFPEEAPWVFFTKKSASRKFLPLFGKRARIFDLWYLLKYGYPLSVGIMAGFINRHRNAVVFGSNSLFFYLMLPYLSRRVRRIDLMHAFGGGAEEFSLPVARELDARVVISAKTEELFRAQYRREGLPADLAERVVVMENRVAVPAACPGKEERPRLKVLYVGRGSEEKRVHLVGRIASRCSERKIPVEVCLVGDALGAVHAADRPHCRFLGEISEPLQMESLYEGADLLLLTSSREGFPMVIMEAMAHGVVPVSTDVGGIPLHVASGETGWLLSKSMTEEQIVEEMCLVIDGMCRDRGLLRIMSRAAHEYAREHFGGRRFCEAYRSLLLFGLNPPSGSA